MERLATELVPQQGLGEAAIANVAGQSADGH